MFRPIYLIFSILAITLLHNCSTPKEVDPPNTPSLSSQVKRGNSIFNQNCAACHSFDRRLVGPSLACVTENRSKAWITSFVRNSKGMIAEGDEQAVAIHEEFNGIPMINFNFTDEQMDDLLSFMTEKCRAHQ